MGSSRHHARESRPRTLFLAASCSQVNAGNTLAPALLFQAQHPGRDQRGKRLESRPSETSRRCSACVFSAPFFESQGITVFAVPQFPPGFARPGTAKLAGGLTFLGVIVLHNCSRVHGSYANRSREVDLSANANRGSRLATATARVRLAEEVSHGGKARETPSGGPAFLSVLIIKNA